MTYIICGIVIFVFCLGFRLSRIMNVSANAIVLSRKSMQIMRDATIDEREKEKIIQKTSIDLLLNFASILLRAMGIIAVIALILFLSDFLGLANATDVIDLLQTWQAIILAALVLSISLIWR